ncbi:MAG: hypothetical protein HKP62_04555 [Sulfurovum sp.]|nr:hypothetical protein [Sulfurovum sp.]NNJ45269.1 hypothetical protein [Sulfurovum sp.]
MALSKLTEIPGTVLTRNHAPAFFDWLDTMTDKVNEVEGTSTLREGVIAITADAGLNAASNGDALSGLLSFSDDGGSALGIGDFSAGDFILSSNGASSKLFYVYSVSSTLYVGDADSSYAPDGMSALASGDTFFVANDLLDTTAAEELYSIYAFNGTALVKLGDVDYATEIDNLAGALGAVVDSDGNYVAHTTSNYIDTNSDVTEDLLDIDTQLKTTTDAAATNATAISNIIDGTTPRTGVITNTTNVGTAGTNVVAEEVGDGKHFVTTLTLTDVVIGAPNAGNNSAHGALIYTFPAGVHVHKISHFNVGLTVGTVTSDTPDAGLGSTEATGAQALLSGVGATAEDYITGQTWAVALDGTAQAAAPIGAVAGLMTGISLNDTSDAKTVYLNVADGWDAGVTGNLTASGTVVLTWDDIA